MSRHEFPELHTTSCGQPVTTYCGKTRAFEEPSGAKAQNSLAALVGCDWRNGDGFLIWAGDLNADTSDDYDNAFGTGAWWRYQRIARVRSRHHFDWI